MKLSRVLLSLLPLAIACSDDGAAGKNSLVITTDEPAGSNCGGGGLKVESGLDANGDGELVDDEVTSTSYVCSGTDGDDGNNGSDGGTGTAVLSTAVTEASETDCPEGGSQIDFLNEDDDAVGDPLIICDADPAEAFGETPVVRARALANATGVLAGESFSATGSAVRLSAAITVPGPGTIIAIGSSLAYCDSTGSFPAYGDCYSASTGATAAWLTVLPSNGALDGNGGEAVFQYLAPDVDNAMNVTTKFDVGAAGTYDYSLVGLASDIDHTDVSDGAVASVVYYGGSDLTLIFIPH